MENMSRHDINNNNKHIRSLKNFNNALIVHRYLTYFSILSLDCYGVKTQAITKRRQLTIRCSPGLLRSLHCPFHLRTVRLHWVVRHCRRVVGLLE